MIETVRALSAARLRDILNDLHEKDPDNEGWQRDVVVRVTDESSIGGLRFVGFEVGCTERSALCLDGDPEAYSDDDADETDDEGGEGGA